MGGYQFIGWALEAHDVVLDPILEAVALKYVSVSGGNNLVGVDRLAEGHVGRGVAGDHRAAALDQQDGRGRWRAGVAGILPAVIEAIPLPVAEAVAGVQPAATAVGRKRGGHVGSGRILLYMCTV